MAFLQDCPWFYWLDAVSVISMLNFDLSNVPAFCRDCSFLLICLDDPDFFGCCFDLTPDVCNSKEVDFAWGVDD